MTGRSSGMMIRCLASALTIGAAVLVAWPCAAADLARQSRIGAIFADDAPVVVQAPQPAPLRGATLDVVETVYPLQPRLPGYYGRPRDFAYRNYYGTSPVTIFSRLPYACGFVALC